MVGIDLQGATLVEATLRGARLHGGCLRGADLRRVRADELQGRDLDLELSSLAEASLRGALLSLAILLDADLRGADLRGANLRGADLRGADLRDADLRDANLANADLTGARIAGAQLDGVLAARACLNRVEDPDGHALEALLAAGGYAGPLLRWCRRGRSPDARAEARAACPEPWRPHQRLDRVRPAGLLLGRRPRSGFAERAGPHGSVGRSGTPLWPSARPAGPGFGSSGRPTGRGASRNGRRSGPPRARWRPRGASGRPARPRLVDPVVRPSSVREGARCSALR